MLDEAFIVFFMYHILCFTEFVPEESTKNIMGYSAMACMLLHLVCFYCVLAYFTTKRFKK